MNTITKNKTESVLNRLHEDAKNDMMRMSTKKLSAIFRSLTPKDFEDTYLPISAEQGQHLKHLILDNEYKNIVEFGTSFGISTIYLAQGVKQIGGKVLTTELLESKAIKALQNITEAGLDEYVEIKVGDAMQTLQGFDEPIDLLLLDGWKDLYLPLFNMLKPNFHKGTLIYVDNADMDDTQHFLKTVATTGKYHLEPMFDNSVVLISLKQSNT